MVDLIDVDKLKNEAISAIDMLFGEDDDDSISDDFTGPVVPEQGVVDQGMGVNFDQGMTVNFDTLTEDLMTIDWEYSDERIHEFESNLDTILKRYTDKYNQALLKMIKSVVCYLGKARDKAYPETMNVLPDIIKTLQDINSNNFDSQLIPQKVMQAYKQVLALRNNISLYNHRIQTETRLEHQQAPVAIHEAGFVSDTRPGMDVEILNRLKLHEHRIALLEEQNKKLKQIIIDMQHITSPAAIAKPETRFELTDDEPESTVDSISFDQIDDNESGTDMFFAESTADTLEENDIQLDDTQSFDSFASDFSEPKISFGQADQESELIQADDIAYDEVETIGADEIVYDQAHTAVSEQAQTTDTPIDAALYVQCCKLDNEVIALPEKVIHNIYRLPPKLAEKIDDLQTIELKDLSSGLFFKLSKGMKGALKGKSDKELKGLSADIKWLRNELEAYSFGVLCSCDKGRLILIPITDNFDNRLSQVREMKMLNNDFSDTIVNIDDQGTIPLVDPCK